MRALPLVLFLAMATASGQEAAHPATQVPPAQPPVVLQPPPAPAPRVDLKTGKPEPQRLCTREVFTPCPDERSRNCTRKETYRCD